MRRGRPLPPDIVPPAGTGRTIPRREFLRLAALGAGGVAVSGALPGRLSAQTAADVFPDGIKSGDPQPTSGVIWTRVAPPRQLGTPGQGKGARLT